MPNELVAEFLYENTSTTIDHYVVHGCAFATILLITTKNRRETSNAQRRTSNVQCGRITGAYGVRHSGSCRIISG